METINYDSIVNSNHDFQIRIAEEEFNLEFCTTLDLNQMVHLH